MTIRVVIADDQALVRGGFRMILDARDGIDVVGEAGDGDEAVQVVTGLEPDVEPSGRHGLPALDAVPLFVASRWDPDLCRLPGEDVSRAPERVAVVGLRGQLRGITPEPPPGVTVDIASRRRRRRRGAAPVY